MTCDLDDSSQAKDIDEVPNKISPIESQSGNPGTLKTPVSVPVPSLTSTTHRVLPPKASLLPAFNPPPPPPLNFAPTDRLRILLTRASVYSSFLAENLEKRQREFRNSNEADLGSDVAIRGHEPQGDGEVEGMKRKADSDDTAVNPTIKRVKATPDLHPLPSPPNSPECSPQRSSSSTNIISTVSSTTTTSAVDTENSGSTVEHLVTRQPSLLQNVTLRDYQVVGMEWLISLYENGLSGILADEMGLGKTLQIIAFLAHLWEMGTTGPFLIVAPLSTVSNWVAEFERFAPSLPVLLYHADKSERAWLRKHKLTANPPPIVITTYDLALRDAPVLSTLVPWHLMIVDEGHRLKNRASKCLRELKRYGARNRVVVTGTPVQNSVEELWVLLNFVMPEVFGDWEKFGGWFGFQQPSDDNGDTEERHEQQDDHSPGGKTEKEETSPVAVPPAPARRAVHPIMSRQQKTQFVTQLHTILKPFLLRRIKSEVEVSLPKKKEYILYAPLTLVQQRLYNAARRGQLRDAIAGYLMWSGGFGAKAIEDDEGDEQASRRDAWGRSVDMNVRSQKLQSRAVQFRKICNHPYLFHLQGDEDMSPGGEGGFDWAGLWGASETPTKEAQPNKRGRGRGKGVGDRNEFEKDSEGLEIPKLMNLPPLLRLSGKFMLLATLLPPLLRANHKILIFSQMTKTLDLLAAWFGQSQVPYCRLDGSTPLDARSAQIHHFTYTPSTKLFLLSTRAGGLGINLVAADTVVLVDSDWNPQMDVQAQDRVHRIGQRKGVLVYRIVTRGTVEERIWEVAVAKRKVEKCVVHKALFKGQAETFRPGGGVIVSNSDLAQILEAETEEQHVNGSSLNPADDDGGEWAGGWQLSPEGQEAEEQRLKEQLPTSEDLKILMDRTGLTSSVSSSNASDTSSTDSEMHNSSRSSSSSSSQAVTSVTGRWRLVDWEI
ncbi:SNF2 family N-terminal domain-containing protein [Phlyctochytrium arcticum]|nr:SNF2 family N-terminal domain-containing protein [Phlyctochytrium arcticum]